MSDRFIAVSYLGMLAALGTAISGVVCGAAWGWVALYVLDAGLFATSVLIALAHKKRWDDDW